MKFSKDAKARFLMYLLSVTANSPLPLVLERERHYGGGGAMDLGLTLLSFMTVTMEKMLAVILMMALMMPIRPPRSPGCMG
jgi:hypothetical protein